VELVAEALNDRGRALKGSRVAVLGVAFKPNVRDARNSPAGAILALLAERGAEIGYHDPHVPRFRDDAGAEHESRDLAGLLDHADVTLVVTPHRAIDWDLAYARSSLVVDTVGQSRSRSVEPRQVLRLGAGWS
jgi:UDP-N-acetyl-D-glucosamine dehydrogenase